jgi:hypothetical protein
MRKLQIYLTPGHFSVTIQNGVSRETSGENAAVVLDNMPSDDREALVKFCNAVVSYCLVTTEESKEIAKRKLIVGEK